MSEHRDQRCATCRWWGDPAPRSLLPSTHRPCTNPKLMEGVPHPPPPPDTLVYEYEEGGSIGTGPGFGCIHHAPAADAPTIIEGNP